MVKQLKDDLGKDLEEDKKYFARISPSCGLDPVKTH